MVFWKPKGVERICRNPWENNRKGLNQQTYMGLKVWMMNDVITAPTTCEVEVEKVRAGKLNKETWNNSKGTSEIMNSRRWKLPGFRFCLINISILYSSLEEGSFPLICMMVVGRPSKSTLAFFPVESTWHWDQSSMTWHNQGHTKSFSFSGRQEKPQKGTWWTSKTTPKKCGIFMAALKNQAPC